MSTEKLEHLSAEAREWWDRFAWEDMPPDGELVLLGVCEMVDRKLQAQAVVLAEGLTVTDRYDQKKPHPACVVEARCQTAILQGLKRLSEIHWRSRHADFA